MSLVKWIDFQTLGDERGSLVSIEQGKIVPFEIKRVYYIYRTAEGVSRCGLRNSSRKIWPG